MVKILKSWIPLFDTVFVLVFGYTFFEFVLLASTLSLSELLNFKNIGNGIFLLLSFLFLGVRVFDYLYKRKINKRITRNENIVAANNKIISETNKRNMMLEEELFKIRIQQAKNNN